MVSIITGSVVNISKDSVWFQAHLPLLAITENSLNAVGIQIPVCRIKYNTNTNVSRIKMR